MAVKILYISLLCSHFEYASIIWNPVFKVDILKTERVQDLFVIFMNHKQFDIDKKNQNTTLVS